MLLCCFRWALNPSAIGTARFEAISTFRKCGFPYGLHNSLYTLHLFCSLEFHQLRHKCNTRYGWLVKPFPAGTFTLQDAPSFAWRTNAVLTEKIYDGGFFACFCKKGDNVNLSGAAACVLCYGVYTYVYATSPASQGPSQILKTPKNSTMPSMPRVEIK